MNMTKQMKIPRLSSKQSWLGKGVKCSGRTLCLGSWRQRNSVSPSWKWTNECVPGFPKSIIVVLEVLWACKHAKGESFFQRRRSASSSVPCIFKNTTTLLCVARTGAMLAFTRGELLWAFDEGACFCQNCGIHVAFFSEGQTSCLPWLTHLVEISVIRTSVVVIWNVETKRSMFWVVNWDWGMRLWVLSRAGERKLKGASWLAWELRNCGGMPLRTKTHFGQTPKELAWDRHLVTMFIGTAEDFKTLSYWF